MISDEDQLISEWQWLLSFSAAIKAAEALTRRTPFPESFKILNKDTRNSTPVAMVRKLNIYKHQAPREFIKFARRQGTDKSSVLRNTTMKYQILNGYFLFITAIYSNINQS